VDAREVLDELRSEQAAQARPEAAAQAGDARAADLRRLGDAVANA
jgi:hypothetical protein